MQNLYEDNIFICVRHSLCTTATAGAWSRPLSAISWEICWPNHRSTTSTRFSTEKSWRLWAESWMSSTYEQVSSINSSLLMGQPRQFSFYFMFHFKIQMTISTDEYVTVIIKQINYIDYIMKKSNYSGEVVVAAGGHFFVTEGAIISWKKR